MQKIITAIPPLPTLAFTDLTPSIVRTNASTYRAALQATGDNFNNVDQVSYSWSGPDSGSATLKRGETAWNAYVKVLSNKTMTLSPMVLYQFTSSQSKTWTWKVTLRDTSGAIASRSFTVIYNP
jgi:hypothetical protein